MKQHPQQRVTITLAAGKYADALENLVGRKEKTAQQAAQLCLCGAGRKLGQVIEDARVLVELFVLILGKVICLNVVAQAVFASAQRLFSSKQLDQRGFSCAVHPNQRDAIAALNHEADVAKNFFLTIGFCDPGELGDNPTARLWLRKRKVDRLLFFRQLDAIHLFEFFDPALHLLGLGRLITETIDEYFQLLDTLPLVSVCSFELLEALSLLLFVVVVIAGVEVNALVPDFHDLADCDIEEIAVVRDQNERVWIFGEIFFQPVARFEIEMVRRLIQQQQVRLLQQQLGKRDAHLPSAREFVSLPMPIVLTKSESSEHAAHLRLDGIAVTGLEFMLYTLIAIGDLCILLRGVVQLRHAARKLLHLFFHGAQLGKNRHAFGKNCAAG